MEEIEIKKAYLPIPQNFKLAGMKKMNVIVGKNNVGKTRFFEAVQKEYEKTFDIIFIKASDTNPSDDHFKTTAATSELVKNISKLFNNLNIGAKLTEIKNIQIKLNELFYKTNINFKEFSSTENILIDNQVGDTVKIESVVQGLLGKFRIKEDGVEDFLDLGDIGQGYQRLFVASILKAYTDMVAEMGVKKKQKGSKEVLFIFEEPELFLHPKLKRALNKTLKVISEYYTVVISTHDPYFLWSNLNDDEIKIYSFVKEEGLTASKEDGVSFEIEDEMLHISLFNRLISIMKKEKKNFNLGIDMEKTSKDMESYLLQNHKERIIKKSYRYKNKNYNVLLPIYMRNTMHHGIISDYRGEDLEKSVAMMNIILSEIKK